MQEERAPAATGDNLGKSKDKTGMAGTAAGFTPSTPRNKTPLSPGARLVYTLQCTGGTAAVHDRTRRRLQRV